MIGWIIVHEGNLSKCFYDRKIYTNFHEAEFEALRQVRDIIRDEIWNWKTYKGLSGHVFCNIPRTWRIASAGLKKVIFVSSEEYDENGFLEQRLTSVLLREVEF